MYEAICKIHTHISILLTLYLHAYSATFGLAFEIARNKVDFPAFGNLIKAVLIVIAVLYTANHTKIVSKNFIKLKYPTTKRGYSA